MKFVSQTSQRSIIIPAALLLFVCITVGARAEGPGYSFGDSQGKNDACMACHGNQAKVAAKWYIDANKFSHTTHAKFGCTTCHDAITGSHPDGKTASFTTTCRDCHADTAAQYSQNFHAKNASCSGCHNPHRVYRPEEISGDELNRQCGNCHKQEKIVSSHSRWLPQAGLHLGAIACVTCHSKAQDYVISIYIGKRHGTTEEKLAPAGYDELSRLTAGEDIQSVIDRNRDNYISITELQQFNRDPANKEFFLKAMLTPVKPTHAFQTFDNRWDCTFCHASGPQIMQKSFVSFPEKNGTFRQVAVEKGAVLKALQTVPNFYLMGSTRNSTLNKIGFLIIAGGMIMPVGHGLLRFLTRKNRK